MKPLPASILQRLQYELGELDRELVHIDGKMLKPSQCFRVETDPPHVLFNTNCPDSLKQRIESILNKHIPREGRTQQ
jgi:hypothetical protein